MDAREWVCSAVERSGDRAQEPPARRRNHPDHRDRPRGRPGPSQHGAGSCVGRMGGLGMADMPHRRTGLGPAHGRSADLRPPLCPVHVGRDRRRRRSRHILSARSGGCSVGLTASGSWSQPRRPAPKWGAPIPTRPAHQDRVKESNCRGSKYPPAKPGALEVGPLKAAAPLDRSCSALNCSLAERATVVPHVPHFSPCRPWVQQNVPFALLHGVA